jgi:hypothetical protein
VKEVLGRFGVRCGHHGTVSAFLESLREWGWIYVRAEARWHAREDGGHRHKGRARAYGVGGALAHKFERAVRSEPASSERPVEVRPDGPRPSGSAPLNKEGTTAYLSITSHRPSSADPLSATAPDAPARRQGVIPVSRASALDTAVERNKGSPSNGGSANTAA